MIPLSKLQRTPDHAIPISNSTLPLMPRAMVDRARAAVPRPAVESCQINRFASATEILKPVSNTPCWNPEILFGHVVNARVQDQVLHPKKIL